MRAALKPNALNNPLKALSEIETKSIQSPNSLTEMIAMGSDFNLHEFNRSFKEYT